MLNPTLTLFLLGLAVESFLLLYGLENWPTPKHWLENTKLNCPDYGHRQDPKYSDFSVYTVSIGGFGTFLGLVVELKFMPTYKYDIHKTKGFPKHFFRVLLNFIFVISTTIF